MKKLLFLSILMMVILSFVVVADKDLWINTKFVSQADADTWNQIPTTLFNSMSDDDIRKQLNLFSEDDLERASNLPDFVIKNFINRNYPDITDSNIDRGLIIFRTEFSEQGLGTDVVGLENAILRVRKESTKAKLEIVLSRINMDSRAELDGLQGLEFKEFDNPEFGENVKATATGRRERRLFGLFPMLSRVSYFVLDDGTIIQKRGFFDFLFSEAQK